MGAFLRLHGTSPDKRQNASFRRFSVGVRTGIKVTMAGRSPRGQPFTQRPCHRPTEPLKPLGLYDLLHDTAIPIQSPLTSPTGETMPFWQTGRRTVPRCLPQLPGATGTPGLASSPLGGFAAGSNRHDRQSTLDRRNARRRQNASHCRRVGTAHRPVTRRKIPLAPNRWIVLLAEKNLAAQGGEWS
jgi:hypothetical protein